MSGAHDGPALSAGVIDCAACGFAHLDPLPTAAELDAFYERDYYEGYYSAMLAKYRAEQAFWDLEHADRLDAWGALLAPGAPRLVDVGCGGGMLLEAARDRGWATLGIDPADAAAEECRRLGLDVRHATYEAVALEPGSADVVHARFVLEHLPDPRHFLGWAHAALRPGGVVSIAVPNDFNALQLTARDALGLHDWWVAPPDHVNYFSFASLERLLAAGGFEPAARDTTFPMEWFLLMGDDYVRDEALGARVHERRMRLETALEAAGERRAQHAHWAARGAGREAVVHARRLAT